MKTNIVVGASACLLGLAMSFSGPANAFPFQPPHACNENNIGEIYEVQQGPYRHGQPYRIYRWECYDNGWALINNILCDYYGDGCVEL